MVSHEPNKIITKNKNKLNIVILNKIITQHKHKRSKNKHKLNIIIKSMKYEFNIEHNTIFTIKILKR
jgi:hypothetical protein